MICKSTNFFQKRQSVQHITIVRQRQLCWIHPCPDESNTLFDNRPISPVPEPIPIKILVEERIKNDCRRFLWKYDSFGLWKNILIPQAKDGMILPHCKHTNQEEITLLDKQTIKTNGTIEKKSIFILYEWR